MVAKIYENENMKSVPYVQISYSGGNNFHFEKKKNHFRESKGGTIKKYVKKKTKKIISIREIIPPKKKILRSCFQFSLTKNARGVKIKSIQNLEFSHLALKGPVGKYIYKLRKNSYCIFH